MDILTILSNSGETPITLAELAEKTNLNKSTCSHIVDTMCEELYVERVSRKEGYRLGPWSYMLSRYGSYYNSLSKLSYPILKWLHNQLDAAVFLSVVCNGRKYIILHIYVLGCFLKGFVVNPFITLAAMAWGIIPALSMRLFEKKMKTAKRIKRPASFFATSPTRTANTRTT